MLYEAVVNLIGEVPVGFEPLVYVACILAVSYTHLLVWGQGLCLCFDSLEFYFGKCYAGIKKLQWSG